jgi:hypothetical protein
MKRTLLAVIVVLTTAITGLTQDKIDVKGAWTMTIESPQGEIPITLKFDESDGEMIKGQLMAAQGDLAISGKVTGKDITFSGTFPGPNGSIAIQFTGVIENVDLMGGEADFGGVGTGKWTAKRAK